MFPHIMSRSEPSANDPPTLPAADLKRVLEQHVATGFPPDLALDLVLNELVVRAADAARGSAAALALMRGDEMVCRASTGLHAPDLGIPIDTRDGLSGACVRSHTPQISNDAEADPRVDGAACRRLNIRSMLVVPVFEDECSNGTGRELAGVLEVFSPLAYAFDERTQTLLEEFARESSRIRRAAAGLRATQPTPELFPPGLASFAPAVPEDAAHLPAARARQPYEVWTLALAALVILAAIGVSFLIGSRIGWLGSPQPAASTGAASADTSVSAANTGAAPTTAKSARRKAERPTDKPSSAASNGSSDDLVVYDKGRVVFRMKTAQANSSRSSHQSAVADEAAASAPVGTDHAAAQAPSPIVSASSSTRIPSPRAVWLAPDEAEDRLLNRVEPEYPADALAAHHSGNVVLEVHVTEDGTVSSVRTLSGDPVLAAAAVQAVRSWRYQPYPVQGRPAEFQTDVTLKFALPE
jgi:TonB family protein